MNIHEYQAKEIFRKYGIPIPPGEVAATPEEAEAAARKFGTTVVVKAQVHAGGRGKAGGVKLARTPTEAKSIAAQILKLTIKGLPVQKVLVTPAADIASEAYVGIIIDRASKRPVFMASPAGGIDIEEVAAKTPEKILRHPVDPRYGLQPFEAIQLAFFLYSDINQVRRTAKILQQLYQAFSENGGSLAEINPLATTRTGDVVALDAVTDGQGVEAEHLRQHAGRLLVAGGDVHPDEPVIATEQGLELFDRALFNARRGHQPNLHSARILSGRSDPGPRRRTPGVCRWETSQRQMIIAGHALVQNVPEGHRELEVKAGRPPAGSRVPWLTLMI